MRDIWNGCMLLVILLVLACNQGCGSAPQAPTPDVIVQSYPIAPLVPKQVLLTLFNQGTQDSAFGAKYTITENLTTTVPSTLVRINGTTDQNGLAVGVDFGVGQCYYNGNTETPNVFTWADCTNDLIPGSQLTFKSDDQISLWSYAHVMSSDSNIEMILTGETN